MDYERLVNRHKDAVYRQLFRMCGNHEDAEDVLVEALVRAHRALGALENEESFRAWLTQIARRACGRLKQREKFRPLVALASLEGSGREPAAEDEDVEGKLWEQHLKDCILRAFDSLPKPYADVYRARDVEGLSAEETAKRLGLSVAAVKSRLHRARALVRERIDCDLGSPT